MLTRNPDCQLCKRRDDAKPDSICLPARPLNVSNRDRALLCVGMSPGVTEDRSGEVWHGRAGDCLRNVYLQGISEVADIYGANAVRCLVPPGDSPLASEITACRTYLLSDIRHLSDLYDGNLTILCLGADATRAVFGSNKLNLTKAFKRQGEKVDGISVFSTYHPSAVDRPGGEGKPHLILCVADHMRLVRDHLLGRRSIRSTWKAYCRSPLNPPAPRLSAPLGTRFLSLDIETYGIIRSLPEQKCFHPLKSEKLDGCSRDDLIQTVALSFRVAEGHGTAIGINSAIFTWDTTGRAALLAWLTWARDNHLTILGQNIQFDLLYLRYCDKKLRKILAPGEIPVWDLLLTNFYDNPNRPERSLKDLSVLLGLGAYAENNDEYIDKYDSILQAYNMEDTEKTLCCHEILTARIADGPERTWGLSAYTYDTYSDILWEMISMSEVGVPVDVPRLRRYSSLLEQGQRALRERAAATGIILAGEGSQKSRRKFISDLCDTTYNTPWVTEKTGQVQLTEAHILHLSSKIGGAADQTRPLRVMLAHEKVRKLHSTYTKPYLDGGTKLNQYRSQQVDGIFYPLWYPCPSVDKYGDAGGGQKQGRIACRYPPLQTSPAAFKRFYQSRWVGGRLISTDYSQIELIVAALLSGDPSFILDVSSGDMHTATVHRLVDNGALPAVARTLKKWRSICKTMNFAILYGCGPGKLCDILADQGQRLSRSEAEELQQGWFAAYPQFREWQLGLIETAKDQGFLEVPFLGIVRPFPGSSETVQETYTNEICNVLVQAIAALITLSAQTTLSASMRKSSLRSRIILNTYDDVKTDCAPGEFYQYQGLVKSIFPNPPYYKVLTRYLKRSVPLNFSIDRGAIRR